MSDFYRDLPLSNRPRRDESAVSRDRAALVESTLLALATLPGQDAEALRAEGARPGKRSTRDLVDAVVRAYAAADAAAAAIELDPIASGAAAVALAAASHGAIRSILGTATLVATDADWRVGRGPQTESTAQAIVLFLAGRGGYPA